MRAMAPRLLLLGLLLATAAAGEAVAFTAEAVTVAEGGTVQLTVERRDVADGALTIAWSTADLSATAGEDYAAASGSLTWVANDARPRNITIAIHDDREEELDEVFMVVLAGGIQALVTIHDDDAATAAPPAPAGGACGAGWLAGLATLLGALLVGRRRNRDAQA